MKSKTILYWMIYILVALGQAYVIGVYWNAPDDGFPWRIVLTMLPPVAFGAVTIFVMGSGHSGKEEIFFIGITGAIWTLLFVSILIGGEMVWYTVPLAGWIGALVVRYCIHKFLGVCKLNLYLTILVGAVSAAIALGFLYLYGPLDVLPEWMLHPTSAIVFFWQVAMGFLISSGRVAALEEEQEKASA